MLWQFTPYVIPDVISVAVSAWLTLAVWRRRSAPGATALGFLMLGVAIWSLGNVLAYQGVCQALAREGAEIHVNRR